MKYSFLFFFLSVPLFASLVQFSGTPKTVTASGFKVSIFPEAQVQTGELSRPVKLSGFGIKRKMIFFTKVNVYVAASYLDDLSQINAEKPLDSVKDAKVRVMRLFLLRNLTGAELQNGMEEALVLNNVDINAVPFQNLFKAFQSDFKAGQVATLLSWNLGNDLEKVVVEVPKFKDRDFSEEAKWMGFDIWKGWFGIPVDAELKTLQKELLSVPSP